MILNGVQIYLMLLTTADLENIAKFKCVSILFTKKILH